MRHQAWTLGPHDTIRLRGKGNCPLEWAVVGREPHVSPERVAYYQVRVQNTAYTTEWFKNKDGTMDPVQIPFVYYTTEIRERCIDDSAKVSLTLQRGRTVKTMVVPAYASFEIAQ